MLLVIRNNNIWFIYGIYLWFKCGDLERFPKKRSLAFYLFSSTRLINSIKHELSGKIHYVILHVTSSAHILLTRQTSNTPSRLHGCAGWSTSLLFACNKVGLSTDRDSNINDHRIGVFYNYT